MLSLHQLLSGSALHFGLCERWRAIRWLLHSSVTERRMRRRRENRRRGLIIAAWRQQRPSWTLTAAIHPLSHICTRCFTTVPSPLLPTLTRHMHRHARRQDFQMSYLHHRSGRSWVRAFNASRSAKAADRERRTGPEENNTGCQKRVRAAAESESKVRNISFKWLEKMEVKPDAGCMAEEKYCDT